MSLEEAKKLIADQIKNAGKNSTKKKNQSAQPMRQTNSNGDNYTPKEKTDKGQVSQKQSSTEQKIYRIELLSLVHELNPKKEIPEREFIGGIFPRGFLSVIVGAPGVGKSWLISDFIVKLSQGKSYKNETCEPRKALLLAGELGEDGITERIFKLKAEPKQELTLILDQHEAETQGYSLLLNKKDGQKNIEALIEGTKPDILFVDSLISFFDGDENKNAEISEAIKFLSRLAKQYNIAVVITHHARKRLSSEQMKPLCLDDVIGASAINRLAALVIAIERNKNLKANKVTCLKSWFEYFRTFTFAIRDNFYNTGVELFYNFDFQEIADSLDSSNNKPNVSNSKKEILICMKINKNKGATVDEISEATEQSKDAVKQHLKRLSDKNEIIRIGRGKYILPEYITYENDETNEGEIDGEQLEIENKSDDN